jgi:hypothetical protein
VDVLDGRKEGYVFEETYREGGQRRNREESQGTKGVRMTDREGKGDVPRCPCA